VALLLGSIKQIGRSGSSTTTSVSRTFLRNTRDEVTRGDYIAKNGKFNVITGLWRRRKNNGSEEYFYGKPKLSEELVIRPGDEIYVFRTSARNARNGDPQMYLKVKRAQTGGDNSE